MLHLRWYIVEESSLSIQTPQKVTMADGSKTETIVLDEVQCKYCLRTVNQKMDLIKHYRFCLGLKGTKKPAADVSSCEPVLVQQSYKFLVL